MGGGGSKVDPIEAAKKAAISAFKKSIDFSKGVVKPLKNVLKGGEKGMKDALGEVTKELKKFQKELMKPLAGIDKLIKDFEDIIVTFGESVPLRFTNIMKGIETVFTGIFIEMQTFLSNIFKGITNIGILIASCFEFLGSYLRCSIKFTMNLFDCIMYYLVDIILQLLYLPVRLVMWVLYTFLGIDLYFIETRTWNGLVAIDKMVYFYMGFHIVYWPKIIREKCYTCIRLKKSTIKRKASEVNKSFKGQKSSGEIESSSKYFAESGKWPKVRHPSKVK